MKEIMGKIEADLKRQGNLKQIGSNNQFTCEVHGTEHITGYKNLDKYWCEQCEKENKAEEQKQRHISMAHRALNLPSRLKACTFNSYTPKNPKAKNILHSCESFCENVKMSGGLIMLGSIGTGKTHLSIAICQRLCDSAVSCHYTTVSIMVRAIKSTWGENRDETEEEVIARFSRYNVLVIDEVGSQYGSDTERIVISEIINNRYNNNLPTIIIGNVKLSEAQEAIGKRAVDRICHNGKILTFDWQSHRTLAK